MSAACQFADILEKEKEQETGDAIRIADDKLKHKPADSEELPRCPEEQN